MIVFTVASSVACRTRLPPILSATMVSGRLPEASYNVESAVLKSALSSDSGEYVL